jgi:hypothetical protein
MKISIILSVSFSIVFIILVNNVFALSSVSLKYEEPSSAEEVEILRWVKSLPGGALFIDRGSKTSTQANSSFNNFVVTVMMDDQPAHYQTAASSNKNVLDAVVGFINNRFQLKHSIELVIGAGRAVYADTGEKIIFIPFTFFKEARELFIQAGKGDLVNQAVADVVLHTVLHELGHLLIAMYDIPIVGREEDAVDALATVLMLQYARGGAIRVEHTAELYKLDREPIKNLRKWDFMGEHSLNIQRHYQIMCHVYGSDPASYQTLKRRIGFSDDRGLICIDEYRQISQGWAHLLEPYLLTQGHE